MSFLLVQLGFGPFFGCSQGLWPFQDDQASLKYLQRPLFSPLQGEFVLSRWACGGPSGSKPRWRTLQGLKAAWEDQRPLFSMPLPPSWLWGDWGLGIPQWLRLHTFIAKGVGSILGCISRAVVARKKKWLRFVLVWKGVLRSHSYDRFLTSESPTFHKFLVWERGGLLFPICHISFFLSSAMPSWETKVSPFPPRKYPGVESLKFICWVTQEETKDSGKSFLKIISWHASPLPAAYFNFDAKSQILLSSLLPHSLYREISISYLASPHLLGDRGLGLTRARSCLWEGTGKMYPKIVQNKCPGGLCMRKLKITKFDCFAQGYWWDPCFPATGSFGW